MAARLKDKYAKDVAPALRKEFGIDNVMAIPRLQKIVRTWASGRRSPIEDARRGRGGAFRDRRSARRRHEGEEVDRDVQAAHGDAHRRARDPARDRMWEFLDRLINIALPRGPRFPGRVGQGVRRAGQLHARVRDHFIFPEIDYAKTDKSKGLNVTIVTTAGRDDRAKALLAELGMPFAKVSLRERCNGHSGNENQGGEEPKFMTRTVRRCGSAAARGRFPQVRALPHLLPPELPDGVRPGRSEGVVVSR